MMMFAFTLDNLRVLFDSDAIFCVRARGMIIAIRDEKRLSSFDGSVCVWVFLEKLATFTTWRKPYFYVTFLLFHFYMLCLIASLTVDYCCLICVFVRLCFSLFYKNMYSLFALFRVGSF